MELHLGLPQQMARAPAFDPSSADFQDTHEQEAAIRSGTGALTQLLQHEMQAS